MVAMLTIFCRKCGTAKHLERRWIEETDECENATCRTRGYWRTADEPATTYELTTNDRRFLRALRIETDES